MSSPEPSTSRRRLLLVTGMNGSGTSATVRVLGLLGGHLPRATESAGLGEPAKIGRIHQELHQAAGSSWDDVRPIPEEWFESAAARAFRDRLASAFLEEYGEADLAIVTDRHLGRLVPLWLHVAEALSAEPLFVIPFRNPLAAARSLRPRDGFSLHKALVLWLQHVVLAEHGSRGHRRAFLSHAGLLLDPSKALARVSDELRVAWPIPVPKALAGIADVLAEPHHREEWDAGRNEVLPLVREAYELLAGLEGPPGPGDLARLDRIRQACLEADGLLGPLVGATNVSELKKEVSALTDLLHAVAAQKGAQTAPVVATKDPARKANDERRTRRRLRWKSNLILATMAVRSGARGLVDLDWYRRAYPDVPRSRVRALLHFLRHGARENRDPHPLFDVSFYLEKNPDVRSAGVHPLVHFVRTGGAEGRDPHPLFDSSFYLEKNPDVWTTGVNPLLHYLKRGWREGRDPSPWFSTSAYLRAHPELERAGRNPLVHSLGSAPVDSLLASGLPSVGPLRLLHVTNSAPRLTLVTDSLSDGSFFGGVATALILATELARASGRSLRIVTRHAFPKVENYHSLLELHGLARPASLELWTDHDWRRTDHFRLDVSPDDVFLTTSWWTTRAVRASGYAGRVFYVLQECETMFYPHGEEHLAATRVLRDPSLLFMVNTRLLAEYFAGAGYDNIAARAAVFEPAFPGRCYLPGPGSFAAKDRYRLFFYARPHHPRNLYYTGLQLLNEAVRSGMLDTDEVEICLAGAPLEPIQFANGYEPRLLGKLDLQGYLRLLGTVDLGVSLMYTPHPSYPPLEVVASGGVGLTNGFANKARLDAYSRNIVCFDLTDPRDAERSLEAALGLMKDPAARRANYEQGRVHREWSRSLKPAVAFFLEHGRGMSSAVYTRLDVPFAPRAALLKRSLWKEEVRNVVYFYETMDSSTFRYRGYNVCQAMEESRAVRAHFFYGDEIAHVRPYLDEADAFVFIRVKWSPRYEALIDELKRKGKPVLFDLDDLVFDDRYLTLVMNTLSQNLDDEAPIDWFFSYVSRIHRTASLCDGFTCTNEYLAGLLRARYGRVVRIIPNLLNVEQAAVSEVLVKRGRTRGPRFRVGYFSGTPSHNNDFLSISDELLNFMERREDVELAIVGYLDLPPAFEALKAEGRVTCAPLMHYLDLQESIWAADVNLVPLVVNDFTNCKSELKYFEAAIVGVPTIASPTYAYSRAIRQGENGFLCDQGDWQPTLEALYGGRRIEPEALVDEARTLYLNRSRRLEIEKVLLEIVRLN